MRTLFLLVLSVAMFITSPLAAQDKDLVDTGQGIKYTKPSGWVQADKKKGAVSGLHAAGDKKSQIEFRFAKITADRAKSYFATFHTQLGKAKLKRVKEGEKKSYGKFDGMLTEYAAGKDDTSKALFVFEFTTAEGAWLVVGMFDGRARDKHLESYEALLGSLAAD